MNDNDSAHNDLRYERKFLIQGYSFENVRSTVMLHPAHFKEEYPKRKVNNIYCDTPKWQYYEDNVIGIANRRKVRVRWYGEGSRAKNPRVEIKIKDGLLGEKIVLHLKSFAIKDFSWPNVVKEIKEKIRAKGSENIEVIEWICECRPVLKNSYYREYYYQNDYADASKRVRATIDYNITFSSLCGPQNNSLKAEDLVILELKYGVTKDTEISSISQEFPFRMTKSSKYVMGVDTLGLQKQL